MRFRIFFDPNKPMRVVHYRLLRYLRRLDVDLSCAVGARPGWNAARNVALHRKGKFFYITDIHAAYKSVDGSRLASVLRSLDPRVAAEGFEVEWFLDEYCLTEDGGLITGAPASPDLFNILLAVLVDAELKEYCGRWGITYSRYLDDLIFSSAAPIGKRKRRKIRAVVEEAGFQINHRKSEVRDLEKGPIVINGVGLEYGGRMFVPRWYLRKLIRTLYRAIHHPGSVNRNKLAGMMGVFFAVPRERFPPRIEQTVTNLLWLYQYTNRGGQRAA